MTTPTEPLAGLLQFYEGSLDFGRKTQAEYSKWLINTLYLLHSGAIAGILTRLPIERIPQFVPALKWFVVGLALAFLTGLATWSNYDWFVRFYGEMIKRIRRGEWKPDDLPGSVKLVTATVWIALVVGLASFGCLVKGGFSTLSAFKTLA